ncbi:DUF1801 domain-containing protein [candidate division KSB1 bacterium]|nr:DUF1801 domain-containing protein [candidate division KSB1 bacterium]
MAVTKTNASRNSPEEVNAYLDNLPIDRKQALERLRKIILKTVPDCIQRVSYQIPIFRLKKDLVGIASQKNHCSFYTMSPNLVNEMKNDLTELNVKGTTIHFDANEPIPEELVVKIIKFRLKEAD